MRKNFLMLLLFSGGMYYSQIGIGDNITTISNSEALKIVSNNKGVILPNINIPNLNQSAPLNITSANSAENESLMLYNTNPTTGKGFYIWRPAGWSALLNSSNAFKYLGVVNSVTTISNAAVNIGTPTGANRYNIDSAPGDTDWQEIPNLTQNIDIYSPKNDVTININGVVQGTNGNNGNSTNSYAIAIFVDGKLKTVRNFILGLPTTCTYNDFNLMSTLKDLAVGTRTIKVYAIYRAQVTSGASNATLAFGDKRSNCSNLTSDMARTVMNVQISEKP